MNREQLMLNIAESIYIGRNGVLDKQIFRQQKEPYFRDAAYSLIVIDPVLAAKDELLGECRMALIHAFAGNDNLVSEIARRALKRLTDAGIV